MGRLKLLVWVLGLAAVLGGLYLHNIRPHEKITALKVFGEYSFSPDRIDLDLQTNRTYRLTKDNSLYLSGGTFKVAGDTIVLTERKTERKMYLLFESEEKLVVLKLDSVPANKKLLCWLKFYPNGEVKFSGGWRNEKKQGNWQYFNEDRTPIKKLIYEQGELK